MTRAPTQTDVAYGTHSERLDVYANDGQPVVLFVHQGGWSDGDKSQAGPIAQALSAYEVVVPNYRLDPVYTYPAQVVDVAEALDYTFDHVAGDRPVALVGFSAGGEIALLVGIEDGRCATMVTWSAPTDLVYMLHVGAAVKPITRYLGGADPGAASPITAVKAGICPVQLHGSHTDFVPAEVQLAMRDALIAQGGEAQALIWTKGHALGYSRFAWPPTLAWLADKL